MGDFKVGDIITGTKENNRYAITNSDSVCVVTGVSRYYNDMFVRVLYDRWHKFNEKYNRDFCVIADKELFKVLMEAR